MNNWSLNKKGKLLERAWQSLSQLTSKLGKTAADEDRLSAPAKAAVRALDAEAAPMCRPLSACLRFISLVAKRESDTGAATYPTEDQ